MILFYKQIHLHIVSSDFYITNFIHSFLCIDGNKIYIIQNGYANDSNSNTNQIPIIDIPIFEVSRIATTQRYNSTNHTTMYRSVKRTGGHWKQMLPASILTSSNIESTTISQNLTFKPLNHPSSTTTYFSGIVEVY